MINSFICLKNQNKQSPNQPDYRLSTNIGSKTQPRYLDIGVGWAKGEGDRRFISFQLSKPHKDKKGWLLESFVEPQEPQGATRTLDMRVEPDQREITPDQIDDAFNSY